MSKFNYKKVMPRYSFIAILMTLVAIAVVGKTMYIMTAKKDYWTKVANRVKVDNAPIPAIRGNIYSADGQLMASSLPRYRLYMDFNALHQYIDLKTKRHLGDSIWDVHLDSICQGLHAIFPERSAKAFRDSLTHARARNEKDYCFWPQRIDFNTFMEVTKLPVFNMPFNTERDEDGYTVKACYKSGFHVRIYKTRQRPYGSLAQRTVGDVYKSSGEARTGLELHYDSLLRGENGIQHTRRTLNAYLDIVDKPAIDGADIVTTIDVGMQDLAERALIDELKLINANVGVAIVMEVKTGDVKAIVNMEKCEDGEYREIKNHAVSDLLEPGSVFKTASFMVALDDGVADTSTVVATGNGKWDMYKRTMKDHNWHRGGYGTLNFGKALQNSSNIGISRIIDQNYHSKPDKFVEGIYRLGLADDLNLPIPGSTKARIRMPKKDKTGKHWANWSNTALPWMSIGYETQVPPISTITFYNAIANGGKMMQPRFVKKVVKDGEVIKEYPPVVLRDQIAKPLTIKKTQEQLELVVKKGTAKIVGKLKHGKFGIAGKTGTAQISHGSGGYHSGTMQYLVSFAGYFPSDAPRYSCIVCIQKSGLPASGGSMSGVVFREIAEGIMAQSLKIDVTASRDEYSSGLPEIKCGNMLATESVLNYLGFNYSTNWENVGSTTEPIWGIAEWNSNKKQAVLKKESHGKADIVPNVHGMGARDAVYLLESRGIKVKLSGRGKVVSQSLACGSPVKKGAICQIVLN